MLEASELREDRRMLPATFADDAPVSQPRFDAINFPLDALWPEGTRAQDGAGNEDAQETKPDP